MFSCDEIAHFVGAGGTSAVSCRDSGSGRHEIFISRAVLARVILDPDANMAAARDRELRQMVVHVAIPQRHHPRQHIAIEQIEPAFEAVRVRRQSE